MYFNSFVVYVYKDGDILRDIDGKIEIPFGSEYSLILKNLNSRIAVARISIDGTDILDGNEVVIQPYDMLKLDGFLKGNIAQNKFKFIEKTKKIEEYRGNKIEDGLIRVEFRFQKEKNPFSYFVSYNSNLIPKSLDNNSGWSNWKAEVTYTSNVDSSDKLIRTASMFDNNKESVYSVGSAAANSFQNKDGITVKGEHINQQFYETYVGNLEETSSVIILQLTGYRNEIPVKKAFTVSDSLICPTCGTKNKYNSHYCGECGTFLR
jgi:hypothetical protein